MSDSLIISWEQKRLVILSGAPSSSELRIEKLAVLDWPADTNPRENRHASGLFLKETLRENGMPTDTALVSLPREAVVLRHLYLPDLPDDELPEIVKLQAATKSAVPADQILIDFLPLPGKNAEGLRPVMIATVDRKNADVIRETLAAAGLGLEGITLESVGLAELAARAATAEYGKCLLAISLSENRLELMFLQNDNVMMMHTTVLAEGVELNKAVTAEINRAAIATEQKVGPTTIGEVVFFADSKLDCEPLRTKYGEHFHSVDLGSFSSIELSGSIRGSQISTTVGALSGLLLNRTQGRIPGLDFVNPRRKTVAKDDRIKKYGLYTAAALTLVAVGLYSFFSYLGDLDTQIADKKAKQSELQGLLKKGEPTLKDHKELSIWQDRNLNLLDEIEQMQSILPGTSLAYLEQFYYDVSIGKDLAKYSAKGVATSRDVAEELYADFGKQGFAVTPQAFKAGRDPDYPVVFDLIMNRPPNSEGPLQAAQSKQPPQAVQQ